LLFQYRCHNKSTGSLLCSRTLKQTTQPDQSSKTQLLDGPDLGYPQCLILLAWRTVCPPPAASWSLRPPHAPLPTGLLPVQRACLGSLGSAAAGNASHCREGGYDERGVVEGEGGNQAGSTGVGLLDLDKPLCRGASCSATLLSTSADHQVVSL
jgi:hypothetical protein